MAAKRKSKKYSSRATLPYVVCTVSVCPVRKKPSDTEEIVTQLLFGECAAVLIRKHNSWMHIRCSHDDYEGWIDSKQVVRISEEEHDSCRSSAIYSLDLVGSVSSSDHTLPILIGSRLPEFDGLHCYLHDDKFVFNGTVIDASKFDAVTAELVERIARKFIHSPYLWGGRSAFGIDCSGYTQLVYQLLGIQIPRDASQQVMKGENVDFLENCLVGDLAFFENSNKDIIHVGIILPDNHIIHASGKVRVDLIDHEGIYNRELRKYTHKFRVAKRILKLEEGELIS